MNPIVSSLSRRALFAFTLVVATVIGRSAPAPSSPLELWHDYNARALPLNEEILRQWHEAGVDYKEVRFDGDPVGPERVRIYGIYAAPSGASGVPGILHAHGGGQTVSPPWLRYWAGRGYAILSINWGGEWPNRDKFTIYPAGLPQGNHRHSSGFKSVSGMMENSWMIWTRVCRRALTYLESQPQVDPVRLGAFGISMGGSLMWNLGIDNRLKAGCAIYGAGWNTYRHEDPKFASNPAEPRLTEDIITWRQLGAPEAYAALVRFPMMFLNASNDQHGDIDRVLDSLAALSPDVPRRHGITPRFRHHIGRDFVGNLPAWMDHFLRGGPALPETPRLSINLDAGGVPTLAVTPDDAQPVDRVEIYYALEHPYAVSRHWRQAATGARVREASAPVMRTDRHLMAYANVHYPGEITISTNLVAVIPASLGAARATLSSSNELFGRTEPDGGWTCFGYPTDPEPTALRDRSYFPKFLDFAGELAVQPDPRVGMATYKPGDPQFRAPNDADRLELSVAKSSGAPIEILLHLSYHRPGTRTFRVVLTPTPQEAWQPFALKLGDFEEVIPSSLQRSGQPLLSFDGIEVIEVKPLTGKPWGTEAPLLGQLRWGSAGGRD